MEGGWWAPDESLEPRLAMNAGWWDRCSPMGATPHCSLPTPPAPVAVFPLPGTVWNGVASYWLYPPLSLYPSWYLAGKYNVIKFHRMIKKRLSTIYRYNFDRIYNFVLELKMIYILINISVRFFRSVNTFWIRMNASRDTFVHFIRSLDYFDLDIIILTCRH